MDLPLRPASWVRLEGVAVDIRPAEPGCEPRLQQVERLSGQQFRSVGLDQIADDKPTAVADLSVYIATGRCWIAAEDDEIVGYLLVDEVDGNAHIEQVSVVPEHQGRGIGRRLINAVEEWAQARGAPALTLTTFTDVPWNRPLYEHLGFRVMDEQEIGPELRDLREKEAAHGLDPEIRVCMLLDVAD